MKRNYDECVTKYSDSFVRVVLDPGYVSRIQNFVTELVEAKSKEDHHKIDSNKEVKRFTTGFLGEAALEKLFGIPIIDWTIGYSGLYHIPDIPGYRVGIKTVERDKFPIIFKDNSYPQIICIKSTKYNNLIFVCGLAKVALVHEKITNQRNDFLQNESTKLIRENQTICIEDLKVKNMMRNHKLAQHIGSASWSKFFDMLTYKSVWYGNDIVKVPTMYPSSQTCSCCGFKNPLVKNLAIRKWECPECHTKHDRDTNASINILDKGLQMQSA